MPVLLQIQCVCCRKFFYLCRSCYRNHKYCSDSCRDENRPPQIKAARQRHRQSIEGKLDHRDQMRRWRAAKRAKNDAVVDHTSPILLLDDLKVLNRQATGMSRVVLCALIASFQPISEGEVHDSDLPACHICARRSKFVYPFDPSLLCSKRRPP